jgi:hypothetical protein
MIDRLIAEQWAVDTELAALSVAVLPPKRRSLNMQQFMRLLIFTTVLTNVGMTMATEAPQFHSDASSETGFYSLLSPETSGGRFVNHGPFRQTKYISIAPLFSAKDIASAKLYTSGKTKTHVVQIRLEARMRNQLVTESQKSHPEVYGVAFILDGEIQWIQSLSEMLANDKLRILSTRERPIAEGVIRWVRSSRKKVMARGDIGFYRLLAPEAREGRFVSQVATAGEAKRISSESIISIPDNIESINVHALGTSQAHAIDIQLKPGVRDQLRAKNRKNARKMEEVGFIFNGQIHWIRGFEELFADDVLRVTTTNDKKAAERLAKQFGSPIAGAIGAKETGFYSLLGPGVGGGRFVKDGSVGTYHISVDPIVTRKEVESATVESSATSGRSAVHIQLTIESRDRLLAAGRKELPQIHGITFVLDGRVMWVRSLNEFLTPKSIPILTTNNKATADGLATRLRTLQAQQ